MRHQKFTFKIGRTSSHRKSLIANQVCSLIFCSKIKTTIAKAKETGKMANKMVTLAKNGSLHCRRRAISKLRNVQAVKILFDKIAPVFINRNGGYTCIHRLLKRRFGDSSEVCLLSFLDIDNNKDMPEQQPSK